jgi:Na+/proline symporter
MLTVFVYAKLWRRSGILTDLEFYELRYSGRAAAFLRGFRAIYLGVFFNIMIMASVSLAAIKIGGILLGLSPVEVVVIGSVITVIYTSLGGLRGVLLTDFFQFSLAMVGMVAAAIVIINRPEIGGLSELLSRPSVADKMPFIPSLNDPAIYIPLFLMPLAVQWWSTWYPGAEPGGGGYIVQRVLAAKNEKHAAGAALFFNIAHYALRPWPWILIALCSLVVFPDLESIAARFPNISPDILDDDLAFSAMLSYLPAGLLGLVIAALIAAYMSTISTQLNWGASYIVHDFYHRYLAPDASEKRLVSAGRIVTVILMILGAILALYLESALGAFNILIKIGAGTGLIFILRWFWWRINAYSEIAAMAISFPVAIYFELFYTGPLESHETLILSVLITTIGWIAVTLLTRPENHETLVGFVKRIRPHGSGWRKVMGSETPTPGVSITFELFNMLLGCVMVYSLLFAIGFFIYGQSGFGAIFLVTAIGCALWLWRNWGRLEFR